MNQLLGVDTVMRAAHAVQGAVESRMQAIGLSGAKFMALKTLADAGEVLPLSQLADRLECVKSNITQLVDRLEADGLVERKADPNDRRTRLAALTASGRKAVTSGKKAMAEAERAVFGGLSSSESQQLARLVGKVAPEP